MAGVTEISRTGDNQLYFIINSLEQSVFRGIFYEAKLCVAEGRKTDAFGIYVMHDYTFIPNGKKVTMKRCSIIIFRTGNRKQTLIDQLCIDKQQAILKDP